MKPTVGGVVHYVSHGTPMRDDGSQAYVSECRAAVITAVPRYIANEPLDGVPNGYEDCWDVDLAVLNPGGLFFDRCVPLDPNRQSGSWHWPERE